MAEPTKTPFRVVIVGAGPVGLFLGHALSRAGIDYVILEQHATVIRHQGAGTLVYPQTIRLLDQLGLWEKADDYLATIQYQSDLLVHNGREIKTSSLWEVIGKKYVNCYHLISGAPGAYEFQSCLSHGCILPDAARRTALRESPRTR
jgi:hypothetical protein